MLKPSSRRRWLLGSPLLLALTLAPLAASEPTPPVDLALAVVYDTSGSMRGTIRTKEGKPEPKYIIAKRAFASVIDRLERFTRTVEGQPTRSLHLSIVVFDGSRPHEALPMNPFRAAAARQWLADLRGPDSATPLGDAMALAGNGLLATPALSKHLLVLTDGENTTGSTPLMALNALQKKTQGQSQPVFVHVLALDLAPEVFASLKKAGATLIGASDEKQLQSQLDFILETQILVEAP